MPDHRRRREPDCRACLAETPAQIDIVPGGFENWVEPTDHVQSVFSEHHVASRNMLGDPVGEQNHTRVPRCVRYCIGFPPIVRWRKVRSPNSRIFSFDDSFGEKL